MKFQEEFLISVQFYFQENQLKLKQIAYILDFYCPQFRLGIELDGEVHSTTEAMDYADNRARFLVNEKNIWVIRFENRVVFENPTRIVEEIREVVKKRRENPTTSPYGYSSFPKEENGDTTDF